MPRIIGLDLSLTSTGIALVMDGKAWVRRITTGNRRGHERLAYLCNEVVPRCRGADLLVVEGPAFSAHQGAFHLGGGWWTVMHALYCAGHRGYVVVSPSTLKVYACGRAGSPKEPVGKDQVIAAVVRRYGHIVEVSGNDTADALVLAAMGADYMGVPLVPVPKTHRRAVDGVTGWPPELAGPDLPIEEGTLPLIAK